MGNTEAGLLLFIESPDQITARWNSSDLPPEHAVPVVTAIHQDLLAGLARLEATTPYLAATHRDGGDYVAGLGEGLSVEVLELPETSGLQVWDSGLSILYNRCRHAKVLCADGQVPDIYPDDVLRARRKLDLYDMVVGREGEDDCWLIGMHGYTDFLSRVASEQAGLLHSILETGVERGQQVSLLDTKTSVRREPTVASLRFLAAREQHPALRQCLDDRDLLRKPNPAP